MKRRFFLWSLPLVAGALKWFRPATESVQVVESIDREARVVTFRDWEGRPGSGPGPLVEGRVMYYNAKTGQHSDMCGCLLSGGSVNDVVTNPCARHQQA